MKEKKYKNVLGGASNTYLAQTAPGTVQGSGVRVDNTDTVFDLRKHRGKQSDGP